MAAYYNENDTFAAAWLRELIKAGLIADGEVDERSIADVRPDDLRGFVQCHFFAGIGGWSYALRLAGWPDDRAVWTGSCPCQPWSTAGRGTRADDSRDLWPTWFRLIEQRRPRVVFGEQVASADGRAWFDRTAGDLERLDYAIGPADLPACSVGTPHVRHRLWFVADASEGRRSETTVRCACSDQIRDMAPSESSGESIVLATRASLQPPWPSGPGHVCRIPIAVDGVSDIVEGRNAAGNAIVPQVAQVFIEAYMSICSESDHVHPDCAASNLHSLSKRYRRGELGAYVIVTLAFVADGHDQLVMFQYDIRALNNGQFSASSKEPNDVDSDDGNGDKSMLIGVIEVLQNPQRVSVRGIGNTLVGLFEFNDSAYIVGDAIYHSARSGCIPFRRVKNRELMPFTVLEQMSISSEDNKLMNQMVQRGANLVQGFAGKEYQADIRRRDIEILDGDEPPDPLAVVDVFLYPNGIRFESGKGDQSLIQVVDMGIGPL